MGWTNVSKEKHIFIYNTCYIVVLQGIQLVQESSVHNYIQVYTYLEGGREREREEKKLFSEQL